MENSCYLCDNLLSGAPILNENDTRYRSTIYGKNGQTLRVHLPYRGSPQAKALWTKEGKRMDKSDRHEIETTETYSHMVIPIADRY